MNLLKCRLETGDAAFRGDMADPAIGALAQAAEAGTGRGVILGGRPEVITIEIGGATRRLTARPSRDV